MNGLLMGGGGGIIIIQDKYTDLEGSNWLWRFLLF